MFSTDLYWLVRDVIVGMVSCWILCRAGFTKLLHFHVVQKRLSVFKTSESKDLQNKPLLKLNIMVFDSNADQVLITIKDAILNDPNLLRFGCAEEVNVIMKILFENKAELFTESMDFILITRYYCNILLIELEKGLDQKSSSSFNNRHIISYDRSIVVEMTSMSSELWFYHFATFAFFAFFASMVIG